LYQETKIMDYRITKLGFAFGNYSDDTYKYEYICINKKRTYVWGIGTNDKFSRDTEINSYVIKVNKL